MIEVSTIDLNGLNTLLRGVQDALMATGRDGDAARVVIDEARKLAMEISNELAPSTKEKGTEKIERDVKQVFLRGPASIFEQSKRKSAVFETDITWLYAGPQFLRGVKDEDFQPRMGMAEMQQALGEQRRSGVSRGKAWIPNGRRGPQHVMIANRTMVSRERFNSLILKISGRVGRMRATFAYAAYRLGFKRVPAWIRVHFDDVSAAGRAVFNDDRLNDPVHPTIEFGSRAPGIERYSEKVMTAVERRRHLMSARIARILGGYEADHRAGKPIGKHADERTMNESFFDAA